MSGGYSIAVAGACDLSVMAALHADALADARVTGHAWDVPGFAEIMAMPGAFGLILLEDGTEPLGLVVARTAADEAEILTLAVRQSAQRRGVAACLMRAAGEEAMRRGAASLFLEVAKTNLGAQALYRALGMAEVGRRRAYYNMPGGPVDAIVLRRDLPLP